MSRIDRPARRPRGRFPGLVAAAVLTVAAVLALGTCSDYGAWDLLAMRALARFTEYGRAMSLTMDNSGQSETLEDFPLLVTLSPGRFDYAAAAAGGADLRFVTADGETTLAHEIEQWNEDGTSWVWVRVSAITGGGSTEIELLYDGPVGAVPEAPEEVWKDYELVYHLSDLTADSGPNASTGTVAGAPSAVAGMVGGAVQGTSAGDHINSGYTAASILTERWTVEAWVNGSDGPGGTADTGPVLGGATFNLSWDHTAANIRGAAFAFDGLQNRGAKFGNPPGSVWHYLVGVYDGGAPAITAYRNGGLIETNTGIGNPLVQSGAATLIGAMDGIVDEVRISAETRSADWVKAQYLSMTDTFITYGQTLTR